MVADVMAAAQAPRHDPREMMSNDTARTLTRGAVGASAFGLAVIGALLLFAPEEFGGAVTDFYVLGAGLFLYLLFFKPGGAR